MNVMEAIRTRRTIRKYTQEKIQRAVLEELTAGARLAPSAMNKQPLEYLIVEEDALLEPVFQTLRWAGYIAPQGNPQEGEKPTAYIIILMNKDLESGWAKYDAGAAIQTLLLGAMEYGIAGCWLGAVDRDKLRDALSIPDKYQIDSVVALGYPAEKSMVEDAEDSIKYYKDENQVMHVPKRKRNDIIHVNRITKQQ